MLKNKADLQSLVYLVGYPGLACWQWRYGISVTPYLSMLLISVGVSIIHHNHTHLPMWHGRTLNRLTNHWLSVLQGCPSFVFFPAHIANHHRYNHGPMDEARTYRFGGDHNHLLGYLLHPFQAMAALQGTLLRGFREDRSRYPSRYHDTWIQMALIALIWINLSYVDPWKFLWLIFLPQMHSIHWLLGANYLQHAHADGNSPDHFARNFTGLMNRIWFNIGFHTAHHRYPRAHWSKLRALHEEEKNLPHKLVERSLVAYVIRIYLLSAFIPRLRSQSLMKPENEAFAEIPVIEDLGRRTS